MVYIQYMIIISLSGWFLYYLYGIYEINFKNPLYYTKNEVKLYTVGWGMMATFMLIVIYGILKL